MVLSALFLVASGPGAEAVDSPGQEILRDSNARSAVRLCTGPTNLTCMESLTAILPDGSSNDLKLVWAEEGSDLDSQGQVQERSQAAWSFVDVDGSTRQVMTYGNLSGENYKGEQVNFRLQPKLDFGFMNLTEKDVRSGIKFKFVFRSSWVVPVASFLMAANSDYSDQKIANGHRYTYIGSPYLGSNYWNKPLFDLPESEQLTTKSDSEEVRFYFLIDHASSIPGGSYGDTRCSALGYPVTSHNAFGGGIPNLSDNDTMKFEIYSPHFLSTGELNMGFFSTYMSVAWMDCMWPKNNVTKSPKVEVSVVNADGSTQIATTSFNIRDGFLVVHAYGFHYSAPTIRLKVVKPDFAPEVTPVATKVSASATSKASKPVAKAKSTTITCYKGKTTKKVTSVNPRCPVGYKKK